MIGNSREPARRNVLTTGGMLITVAGILLIALRFHHPGFGKALFYGLIAIAIGQALVRISLWRR